MNMAIVFPFQTLPINYLGSLGGENRNRQCYTEIQRIALNLTDKEGISDRKVPLQPLCFYKRWQVWRVAVSYVRSPRAFKDFIRKRTIQLFLVVREDLQMSLRVHYIRLLKTAAPNIDNKIQRELMLVADALRSLEDRFSSLPAMLRTQESDDFFQKLGYPTIKMLLNACDALGHRNARWFPYIICSTPPGGPFKRGDAVYTFEYTVRSITGVAFKPAVVTSDGQNLVLCAADKTNRDCVLIHSAKTGALVHRITLRQCGIKDVNMLVAMPHKAHLVAVITNDKGSILDIRNKKHIRTIPKWGGSCTADGKFGLYAPTRHVSEIGGLELLELKKGQTVKTFIPKVAEGVFTVICMFNKTDEYVLYYHSGKKTLRVFRTSDAQMIANYRVQAELTSVESTEDGRAVVLGTVDGCVSALAIVDTEKKEMKQYLSTMPSRDEQWKKKLEKQRAQTRFKAVGSIAKLSTMFLGPGKNR
ncbi:hypothetical protein FQR65_LT15045 [Abscondita terminalis]|nr:hypothetical protein FQR65_LT15045 [Abscondita terminalis]